MSGVRRNQDQCGWSVKECAVSASFGSVLKPRQEERRERERERERGRGRGRGRVILHLLSRPTGVRSVARTDHSRY